MSCQPDQQDDGVTAWPASKQWPWDRAVQWFEGSYWSQPGRRLANSLSRKRLEIWDQRFSSGSTLEGWSWHLWQASFTWAASTGEDFASFCELQSSCRTLAWEWRRRSAKRTFAQAKACKAALGADKKQKNVACFQGLGDAPGPFLVVLVYPSIQGLGVVFGKCGGSCYGDSDGCSSEPCPLVRLRLHDCIHHVGPNEEWHIGWHHACQRTWWKQSTFVKGFVGTIPVQIPIFDNKRFSFGAWISGSVRAGVRMGVSFLGRRGLHMAHSFPLVHSLLLLYLLFLCTLRLPGAFVNQGVPFRDSREDCPQHLDIQRQCDSRSFQSLRMLVAGKIWIRLANASGQKSWRSDQRCSGFSPQRFSKFWTAWSYPILRSFVGRLLVFSFIWRTETMGLQMVDDVGGQHRKGSSLRCRIAGLLFWEYEGPRQSPKFCYCWSRALPERTYLAEKGRVQGVGCLPRSGSCWPWQPQQGCRRRFFFTAQPGASATFLGLAAQGRSWIPRRIGRTWEFPKGWSRMAGKEGLPIHPGRHYPI